MATCRRWAAFGLILFTGGCTRIDNALASVPIFAFLREAPSFDPYEHPLPPPPGAVPFISPNGEPEPPLEATEAALNAFAASPAGQTPLSPGDPAALATGQVMFERHCAVCHGVRGAGDGPLVGPGKFPVVPSLVSGTALGRSDGYVYGVVRAGRGLMPSYGARMTNYERWAVVTYMNSLQAAAGGVQTTTAVAPAAPPVDTSAAAPADTSAAAPADTSTAAPADTSTAAPADTSTAAPPDTSAAATPPTQQ